MTHIDWITEFAARLGVDPPSDELVQQILSLAGVAAHQSERPAAPLACYLIGVAGADLTRAAEIAGAINP